ncbi:HK97 family phage prohead protease [Mesorhizobium sp. M0674]|uniref:HK97 family phage prohead protease n=1 Tax=unclassified Mesorhizobium TaxID=325217 RepID=UPI0033394E29
MTTTQRAAARPHSRTRRAMLIAGYATDFGTLARGWNLILPGAFAKLIANGWQPELCLEHEGHPVGRWLRLFEDPRGLFVVGELDGSHRAQAAMAGVESGELPGLSLSRFIGSKARRDDGVNVCREVIHCREISIVTKPANPAALITEFCIGRA